MPGSCTLRSAPRVCNFCIATSNANKTSFVCVGFFLFLFFGWEGVRVASILQKEKGGGGEAFIKPVAPLLSVLHTALSLTASTSLALFPHVPAG